MVRAPLIPSLRRWISVNSRTTQWSALFPGWHSWHLENTHMLALYFLIGSEKQPSLPFKSFHRHCQPASNTEAHIIPEP